MTNIFSCAVSASKFFFWFFKSSFKQIHKTYGKPLKFRTTICGTHVKQHGDRSIHLSISTVNTDTDYNILSESAKRGYKSEFFLRQRLRHHLKKNHSYSLSE